MNSSDLTTLLGNASSGNGGDLLGINSFMQSLLPLLTAITVVSIIFTLLYGWSIYQRWRVNHAIIEIRDMLRDLRSTIKPPETPATPPAKAPADDTSAPSTEKAAQQ